MRTVCHIFNRRFLFLCIAFSADNANSKSTKGKTACLHSPQTVQFTAQYRRIAVNIPGGYSTYCGNGCNSPPVSVSAQNKPCTDAENQRNNNYNCNYAEKIKVHSIISLSTEIGCMGRYYSIISLIAFSISFISSFRFAADIRIAPWPRIITCSSPSLVATRTL